MKDAGGLVLPILNNQCHLPARAAEAQHVGRHPISQVIPISVAFCCGTLLLPNWDLFLAVYVAWHAVYGAHTKQELRWIDLSSSNAACSPSAMSSISNQTSTSPTACTIMAFRLSVLR